MNNSLAILLTGATGFIGSHMLTAFIENGYQVIVLKQPESNAWRIEPWLDQVVVYTTDDSITQIFEQHKISAIVHLATFYNKLDKEFEVRKMLESNVVFPATLLEIGVKRGVKAFINTGTFFEYDRSAVLISEKTAIKPLNYYAKTKLAFEAILETYKEQISINTFRLFSPYGEMDNNKLIPVVIQKGLNSEEVQLSSGGQKLDFLYIKDIVKAYTLSLERFVKSDFQPEYEVFNLGSGISTSIKEVVSIIEEKLGVSVRKHWGEQENLNDLAVLADTTKASKILGWSPRFSIGQGIENTVLYYKHKDQ